MTVRQNSDKLNFLLLNLYGIKGYIDAKDYVTPVLIKKHYLKIAKSLWFSIDNNLKSTCESHKSIIFNHIEKFGKSLKKLKTFEEIDQYMIVFLTELIFYVFGYYPNRAKEDNFINRQEYWKLDYYRSVFSLQNDEQKKNEIFAAVQGKYKNRFKDPHTFIMKVLMNECKGDNHELVQWLKKNHPDIYADIF